MSYGEDFWGCCDDDICPDCCEEPCVCYERDSPCPSCGSPGCPGYCDDHDTYNLRFGETGGIDPDEDGHQRYKDDLAQGLINPDGSQRDPGPPEETGYEDDRADLRDVAGRHDDPAAAWAAGDDDPLGRGDRAEEAPF